MSSSGHNSYLKPYHVRADAIEDGNTCKYILSWIFGIGLIMTASLNFSKPMYDETLVPFKVRCNEKANIGGKLKNSKELFKLAKYCVVCLKTPGLSQRRSELYQKVTFRKPYNDVDFSLRIDYSNDDIYFRGDEIEVVYSELGSICQRSNNFCDNLGMMSNLPEFPAVVNYTKKPTEMTMDDYLKQIGDPRDYLGVVENKTTVNVGIKTQNKESKYLKTSSLFSRRFYSANTYALLLKLKTREATNYIKTVSLISREYNRSYENIKFFCDLAICVCSIIVFIFASVDLTNKKYREWMSINKLMLKIVVIQILGSGMISFCFETFGSELTDSIKLAELFLQALQIVLNFSLYISGFFASKRNNTLASTLKIIAVSLFGIGYLAQRTIRVTVQNYPDIHFLSDVNSILSRYLFVVIAIFYIVILILFCMFLSSLSGNASAQNDKFTTILNTISFISLSIYLFGEIITELSLIENSVLCLFATRINICFFNLFILVISTPLNHEEETMFLDREDRKRKEFGNELEINKIDHLDKYDPEAVDDEYNYDDYDYDDDFEVDVEVGEGDQSSEEDGSEENYYEDRERSQDSEDSDQESY